MPRASKSSEYMSNGVIITPAVPTSGEKVKIMYDGLLSKSGANHIYAYVGFGSSWNNSSYYMMNKNATSYEATLPVLNSDTLNICFKDCANNWDNNSGKNYSFDINQ